MERRERHISVSPQLGRLLAAGGGLWRPRRWEEPQSELVGRRGTEGGEEVEARQDWRPWGRGDQERQTGGTLQEEQEKSRGQSPGPLESGSLLSSQAGSPRPKPHPGGVGPGGIGGRLGRSGEADGRSHPGWAGEEGRVIALPTRAQGACWAPRPVPCPPKHPPGHVCPWGHRKKAEERTGEADGRGPLRPESRRGEEGVYPPHSSPGSLLGSQVRSPALWDQGWGALQGPFCSLTLSPSPHSLQSLFQPCGSWALAPPTAQNSPLFRPCPLQPRPSPPPFFVFVLPPQTACRIFAHETRVWLKLLQWELQVWTTGLTENLRPQGIFIRVRSHGALHLSTKTQLYTIAYKCQCRKPQAKQPVRQENNSTH